ncbi:MAG: DUF2971 domain-containing protein [Lachnospiraceae bacterium]|nr:DUF2971 domain-containing protein [Lachnospiraceae bacterium]
MDDNNWRSFPAKNSAKSLDSYLEGREFSHDRYCHYTSLEALEKIIESHSLLIFCVDGFNDVKDSAQYGDNEKQKKYFALCLSTGINENLPLWYLYSGLNGKGGSISFTKNQIKKVIDNAKFSLVEENDSGFVDFQNLEENKDFHIMFKDLVYADEKEGRVSLKYNTQTNYIFSTDEWKIYRESNIGFVKGLIWYYEKETRLQICLEDHILSKMDLSKKYAVRMSIPENDFMKAKVTLGPEITDATISSDIAAYSNLKAFVWKTSAMGLSKYAGTIEMNLCGKCKKGFK